MKELIKAATIAKAYDRVTGKFLGWGVQSDNSEKYYHIHCYKTTSGGQVWTCDCPAGQNNFKNCKDGKCKHIKAVIETETAKQAARKEAAQAAIAEAERQIKADRAAQVNRRDLAPLNGNQGFSLLR